MHRDKPRRGELGRLARGVRPVVVGHARSPPSQSPHAAVGAHPDAHVKSLVVVATWCDIGHRLVKRADENQRSLEAEVVALFEEVLTPPDVAAMWAGWDDKTKDVVLTDEEILEALRKVRGAR